MKYSQKCICSQEHAIIQTDYRVRQTKMATVLFLCTTLRAKWNRTVGYNSCRAKTNRALAQLRSKAYAVLFLSQQVRATIVANGH